MRQAWDQLGGIYNYSHAVSVAEVDCSRFVHHPPEEDGTIRSRESLCQRYDIKSYPTVLYFTGETGTTGANYTGKHTFDAMHSFLESEREKLCLLDHEKGLKALEPGPACGPEEVKFLEQWRERPPEDALAELERLEAIVSNRAVRERTHAHVISCVGAHSIVLHSLQVTFGASKRTWMGKRINLLKQIRVAHRPEELKTEL